MKTLTKIFATVVMFFIAASTFAQVTATASATGTIVTPIAISKTQDLNFGNVAVSATGGNVILAPAGSRSVTGGVTLPAVAGTVTEARFTITGVANYTYSITLPTTDQYVFKGTDQMTVSAFTSNPSTTGTLDGTGSQTLKVGATLQVNANQAAGTYTTTTPFQVTVNYN
jgi:hypothetical protein